MNSQFRKLSKQQHGLSLVEILVTVLILAVGGLGIASLQLAGLKYSSGSYARTQAVILSDDMANRLKSNRAAALNLQADGSIGDPSAYEAATFAAPGAVGQDCLTQTCDADELATYDIAQWRNEIARTLPAGRGRITITDIAATGQRQFNIAMRWRQTATSTNDTTNTNEIQTVTFRVSL